MKIKTLLKNCTISYLYITLRYYVREFDEPDLSMEQIDIELLHRDDFDNFIATYGNSLVDDWQIESSNGTHYMVFNLKKLVEE